ncbi:MAG: MFS transporter [Firmicutes bacterium]|nr:MFS transporter [Bacillota bacterium]
MDADSTKPRKEKKKTSLKERLAMGGFALSNDLGNNFRSNYRLYFYTNVLAIAPALAGVITMIGTIWDGINDPIIGFMADKHRFKNGEKIRPFAKWFAIPVGLLFVLLFTSYEAPMWAKVVISILFLILFDTCLTALQIAFFGLPMVMTDDQKERVGINVFVMTGGTIGVALASVALWPLIRAFGGVNELGNVANEQKGFFLGAVVVAAICIIMPLLAYRSCKERIQPDEKKESEKLLPTLKLLLKERNWVLNLCYELTYYMSSLLMTSNLLYYTTYVMGSSKSTTLLMGIYLLGSLVMFPFIGIINRKLGRKKTMMIGAIILILSKIAVLAMPDSLTGVELHCLLIGAGCAVCSVMFVSNRADVVDIIAAKNGRRMETIVSTLSTFISKLAMSLVTLGIGLALQFSHYDESLAVQPAETVSCIKAMMGTVPLVIYVIMVIVITRMTIDKDKAAVAQQ